MAVVGTLLINIGDIYCFRILLSMPEDISISPF